MRISIRPLSLSRRIVASVAVGLALILLLFGLVALWTIRESTEAAYRERVMLARVLAGRVDDALRYALVTLEREATSLGIEPGRPLADDQRQRLAALRSELGIFVILSLADASGNTIWTDPTRADVVVGSPLTHVSLQRTLRTYEPQIAEFLLRANGEEKVFACLAVPLRGPTGRLVGVLMAELDPAHPALTLLPTGELGDGLHIQLLNSAGRLLAGSEGYDFGGGPEHQRLLSELVATRTAGYRIHQPPRAGIDSHLVAYAPSAALPSWGIIAEQPRDLVLATTNRLQQRLGLFGLLALALAAAVAWYDVRRVVRPLRHLTVAAERFAAGQFDQPVQLDRTDELGLLGRALEIMRQRLGASLAEVAEWNRSALLDPDRVVALVVRKARDLVSAEVAGLSLVGEGTADLTWRLLIGGSDRFRQIRLRPGQGIAGYVVQTGRTLAITDWEHPVGEGPSAAPILALEGLRSALAVPLQSGGRVFGVLMVANRTPTSFTHDHVVPLTSLANQAAVALDNARLYRKVQSLAAIEERERIAREMHDGLAQVLTYVNTKTLAVARLLELGKVDEARAQVAQLEAAAKEVYADVREAILGLRTTLGPDRSFLAALREYLEGFEQQNSVPVEFDGSEAEASPGLPVATEIQLLRIVQEALANVRKHSRATRVVVRLTSIEGTVRLTIEDDGQGFNPAQLAPNGRPRFGLQTMRERAEATGGIFTVESRPGAGTRVIVAIPPQQREEVLDAADARVVGR